MKRENAEKEEKLRKVLFCADFSSLHVVFLSGMCQLNESLRLVVSRISSVVFN